MTYTVKKNYTELGIPELYDNEYYEKIKNWIKHRKIFACTGWNGFRTAVFIADENDNLIYYYREKSIFTNESVPEDFADSHIDEESVGWGREDGGAEAPYFPTDRR